jgi:hypothetical protein
MLDGMKLCPIIMIISFLCRLLDIHVGTFHFWINYGLGCIKPGVLYTQFDRENKKTRMKIFPEAFVIVGKFAFSISFFVSLAQSSFERTHLPFFFESFKYFLFVYLFFLSCFRFNLKALKVLCVDESNYERILLLFDEK